MERCQEFIGVRCIEAADAYGDGQHLYNMHLTDTEIISCRDCKHFDNRDTMIRQHGQAFCTRNPAAHLPVGNTGNGLCAWAERRES